MKEVAISILANAIWGLVAFLLSVLIAYGVKRFRTRGQRRFWHPFLGGKGPLPVILTDKPGTNPRSPRKISLTDVQAYPDVRSALNSLGRDVEIKARSEADIVQLSRDCFISLGGPKANGISEQVITKLAGKLPVTFDSQSNCFVYNHAQFCAAYDNNKMVERDYGLILRLLKLEKGTLDSKPVLVAFGLHGHGTEQAIRAIKENFELNRQFRLYTKSDSFAFLKFEFTRVKTQSAA